MSLEEKTLHGFIYDKSNVKKIMKKHLTICLLLLSRSHAYKKIYHYHITYNKQIARLTQESVERLAKDMAPRGKVQIFCNSSVVLGESKIKKDFALASTWENICHSPVT